MPKTKTLELPRFGFELEFDAGASDVVRELTQKYPELCQTPTLHSYHCICNSCQYTGSDEYGDPAESLALRGQTDSSCSGEVISYIFNEGDEGRDDARTCYEALQTIAVDVDATPGLRAGLHVHVEHAMLRNEDRGIHAFTWLMWENVFTWIARGRFTNMREFNNPHRRLFVDHVRSGYSDFYDTELEFQDLVHDEERRLHNQGHRGLELRDMLGSFAAKTYSEWVNGLDPINQEDWLSALHRFMSGMDRHSFLVTGTRHGTYEFRLWNSTRAAWRMELYSELSRLWMVPPFINGLMTLQEEGLDPDEDTVTSAGKVLEVVSNVKPDVAPLLERQIEWMKKLDSGDVKIDNAIFLT